MQPRPTEFTPPPARGLAAWPLALPVAAAVALAFLPVVDNGFVDWDDRPNFLENPHFRGVGPDQLSWAWRTFWMGVYQPLGWTLLGLEYLAFRMDPRGYHTAGLALNALNAVVLYALTLALVGRCRPDLRASNPKGVVLGSALTAALYMAHPLRVEAVAWASAQTYLPCAMFAMLAVLAYLSADVSGPRGRAWWLAGAWALFALALLFKAAAVALPLVLLVLDVYPLRRLGGVAGRRPGVSPGQVWAEKIPWFALSAVFAVLAVRAKHRNGVRLEVEQHLGAMERLAQACYGACFYAVKTVWPTGLSAVYPLPRPFDWGGWPFPACASAVAAVTVLLVLFRRRLPGLWAAWLAYLVMVAPNLGFVRVGNYIVADRYSYLPALGAAPLLAGAVAWLTRPGRGRAAVSAVVAAAGLGALAALSVSTWELSRTWHDSESLSLHALANGAGAETVTALGKARERRGDDDGAEVLYREALRRQPGYAPALIYLGLTRVRQGRPDLADPFLREAVRRRPDSPEAHKALGVALTAQGRPDEAAAEFAEAVRILPSDPEARTNLGLALDRARASRPGPPPDPKGP